MFKEFFKGFSHTIGKIIAYIAIAFVLALILGKLDVFALSDYYWFRPEFVTLRTGTSGMNSSAFETCSEQIYCGTLFTNESITPVSKSLYAGTAFFISHNSTDSTISSLSSGSFKISAYLSWQSYGFNATSSNFKPFLQYYNGKSVGTATCDKGEKYTITGPDNIGRFSINYTCDVFKITSKIEALYFGVTSSNSKYINYVYYQPSSFKLYGLDTDKTTDDVINNNDSNTDKILDNQNQNTQDIINNNDKNTDKITSNNDKNTDKIVSSNEKVESQLKENDKTNKNILQKIIEIPSIIINGFLDMLKALFIPSDDYFTNKFNELTELVENKMGVLAYPLTIAIETFEFMLTIEDTGSYFISWSDVIVPNFDFVIIKGGSYDLASVLSNSWVNMAHSLYMTFVSAYLLLSFFKFCKNKYSDMFGGDYDNTDYIVVEESIVDVHNNDDGSKRYVNHTERRYKVGDE